MPEFAAKQDRTGGPNAPEPAQRPRRPRDIIHEAAETTGVGALRADLSQRPALAAQRALHAELNRMPRVVAQAQLADALSRRATQRRSVARDDDASPGTARSTVAPVQRVFSASNDSDTPLVREYIEAVNPRALDAFNEAAGVDEEFNLDDWVVDQLNVTMDAIREWDAGVVRGQLLTLDGDEVPGTNDIAANPAGELEQFRNGLAHYSIGELKRLYDALGDRSAPLDGERRAMLGEHARRLIQQEQAAMLPVEEKSELPYEETEMEVELPNFDESEGSGTETEGSDTEDEREFRESESRRSSAEPRLKWEATRLEPHLYEERMITLHRVLKPEKIEAGKKRARAPEGKSKSRKARAVEVASSEQPQARMWPTEMEEKRKKARKPRVKRLDPAKPSAEALSEAIFTGGKRPTKNRREKTKLYRKETGFRHPSIAVDPRATVPERPSEQETEDLAQLNALLDLGVPIALAEQVVPSKFVVAQYRGLFYARPSFSQRARARHRGLNELDRPVFASAALSNSPLGTAGYYYLYGASGREADLSGYQRRVAQEAQRIREALQALRGVSPEENVRKAAGRATENFEPQSMADIGTHFYSQDYDAYHRALAQSLNRAPEEEPGVLDPLFTGLTGSGNPKVSTGDVPVHAGRYAYGLKPYEGHEEEVLEPEYNAQGKPKHPYSGQIYVSIHPLSDYGPGGPEQLTELQRERRINIAQVILPERESPFEGMMPEGRVKHRMAAKFLNFNKDYKQVYAEKYGMTLELFNAFRTALLDTLPGTEPRTFVESLLSNFLALHSEVRAIEAAIQQARAQNARLVYRTGRSSFGFAPTPLKGGTSSSSSAQGWSLPDLLATLVGRVEKTSASGEESESAEKRINEDYGGVTEISGDGLACYIRSIVTAAAKLYNLLPQEEIEEMVDTIQAHLSSVGLRNVGQAIDAGGLVAAEVRRALTQLVSREDAPPFDPAIHIVQETEMGGLTEYVATTGTQPVYLLYTPGHFSLLNRVDPVPQHELDEL